MFKGKRFACQILYGRDATLGKTRSIQLQYPPHVNPYGHYRFDLGPEPGDAPSHARGVAPQLRLPGTV